MGCTSDQYASLERYLVEKARILTEKGSKLHVVYENMPRSREFIKDFNDAGGELYNIKFKNLFDLNSYRKIYRIIKNKNINVVHGYFSPTCHYLNIYLTLRGYKNLFRTATNLPLSINRNKKGRNPFSAFYLSLRHKMLSFFVKKIICRSRGVKDEYRELGVSPRKLEVASGGVDVNQYRYSFKEREKDRRNYNLNDKTLVVGAFCRLTSIKRIDKLIRMFSVLKTSHQEIKLFIAGEGPESNHLKRLTEKLNLTESVKLLGHRINISKLYSALDIFCLPSSAEGMSNSILEAMASELPIIAADISSNRELIDEGKGGYLISFEDGREFQDKIERLLDKRIRKKMGRYNRHKVSSQFSLKSRIEKEIQIYKELFN